MKKEVEHLRYVKMGDLYPRFKKLTERVFSFFDISSFGVSSLDFKRKFLRWLTKMGLISLTQTVLT